MSARRAATALLLGLAFAGLGASEVRAGATRAAYFYDYMPADHLDSLAAAGFDRALVHWIPDSLDAAGAARLTAFADRGIATGVEVVPEWLLQQASRLAARPAARRYTWGHGTREPTAACPLDSLYWRSALLGRAEETLAAAPRVRRLAVDLELLGAGRHHYDAGPCSCAACVAEYTAGHPELTTRAPSRLTGLLPYEESRLARIFSGLLAEFAARHPGVELGVFDLDFASFVHRALARALARRGVPTADYTERTYASGAPALAGAREPLARAGLTRAPVIGGLWLKRFTPATLAGAVRGLRAAEGYFVFTTYSLWQPPAKLAGPYLLQGSARDYWRALREGNSAP